MCDKIKLFEIREIMEINKCVIVLVEFFGCTDHAGRKLLVFHNVTRAEIEAADSINYRFQDDRFSPIANFEPTARGIELALHLCDFTFDN